MSEGNGQKPSGEERLDRIERALELIIDDHINFREEHKMLLSAQVQMQGGLETLRGQLSTLTGRVDALTGRVDSLTGQVESLAGQVGTLTGQVGTLVSEFRRFAGNVELMRQDFDSRLKRLEA
jgi:chromosome segregation ATPase